MNMEKFLIIGNGSVEAAFASKLAENSNVYAIMEHENPTIIECVEKTGGIWMIGNINDTNIIDNFAKANKIDYILITNEILIDVLSKNNKCIGATKDVARLDDKIYSMQYMLDKCGRSFLSFFKIASNMKQLDEIITIFKNKNMKATIYDGTGKTYSYGQAKKLIKGENLIICENLGGEEFSIMGITDGRSLVTCPAVYNTHNDVSFNNPDHMLPFLTKNDINYCKTIIDNLLAALWMGKISLVGIINGKFLKTKQGIKFMSWNTRFGDFDINVLSILETSFSSLVKQIYDRNLNDIKFKNETCIVKYLNTDDIGTFMIDEDSVRALGVNLFFMSSKSLGKHMYEGFGKLHAVTLTANSDNIHKASKLINQAMKDYIRGHLNKKITTKNDLTLNKSID